jgi:adenosylcobinamide-GDP ribazoletransferase
MSGGAVAALRLLTVIPTGRLAAAPPGGPAVAWFPAVGLLVGTVPALVLLAPLPALPRAALALVAWVAVTGGLHEDGWMDCADAALAPVPAARRAAILKDPLVGAHGATAGMLLMLVRLAALSAVPPVAPLAAAVLGRSAMGLSLAWARPGTDDALGASWAAGVRWTAVLAAAAAALLCVGLLAASVSAAPAAAWRALFLAAALAAFTGAAVGRFLVGRLGVLNGDAHGALGLAAETAALYAFVGS